MLCKLCHANEANKTNTHYLTDKIIRSCLNADGSNQREYGFMFDISNDSPSIAFKFQRNTPRDKFLKALGREPTEEEIEAAKERDFSIDYVFCSKCEIHFSTIEDPFIENILPQLRSNDFTGITEKSFTEARTLRMFFLLQIWRSAVCRNDFKIPDELKESLRLAILDYPALDDTYNLVPLIVTYCSTLGGAKEYTQNAVGYGFFKNHQLIFFNDFIIQYFPSESIQFYDWYGLNNKNSFEHFINYKENEFIFQVFDNTKRIEFFQSSTTRQKVDEIIKRLERLCRETYKRAFGHLPSQKQIDHFIAGLIYDDTIPFETKFTDENMLAYFIKYFKELL